MNSYIPLSVSVPSSLKRFLVFFDILLGFIRERWYVKELSSQGIINCLHLYKNQHFSAFSLSASHVGFRSKWRLTLEVNMLMSIRLLLYCISGIQRWCSIIGIYTHWSNPFGNQVDIRIWAIAVHHQAHGKSRYVLGIRQIQVRRDGLFVTSGQRLLKSEGREFSTFGTTLING
jgi:hypothetical protein